MTLKNRCTNCSRNSHDEKNHDQEEANQSARLPPIRWKVSPPRILSCPTPAAMPVKLGDLIAKGNLVIYFYPKDMTPGCTREACDFRDNLSRVRAAGAQVVGVSTDTPQSHQKFTAKYELNFPLLADPDKRWLRRTGFIRRNPCTAGSSWESNAPPS